MEQKGMIRRFGSYNLQQLEQMKQDLHVQMPLNKLIFCASYYRTVEKRDPSIEELQFLDLFSRGSEKSSLSIAPTELLTNDAFVAKTYADLMAKRHELNPDAKTPCTLYEMMELATAYLERAGKESAPSGLVCSIEKRNTPYTKLGNSTVLEKRASVGLRVLPKKDLPLLKGDLLLLLRPLITRTAKSSIPPVALLDLPAFASQIKQIRTVGKRGLFAEVLSVASCATIEPDRLSQTGEPIPLSMLVTAFEGDLLVRVSREDYPDFAKAAYELGLFAAAFATVGNGTSITVVRPRGTTFTLQTSFLKRLFPLRPVSVRLGNERSDTETPVSHTAHTESSCADLPTASVGTALISAASVAPTQSFFCNALDTTLAAVLTLAVSGCDYADQRLSVSVQLPQSTDDSYVAGACVSTILGVYRLQAELAMPTASIRLDYDPTLDYPTLQVFSVSRGNAVPASFTAAGNPVYCIAPAATDDGLPDFSDLRRLLTHLTALRKKGVVQSARVLCHEEIADALQSMMTAEFGCLTGGKELFSMGALPIGVLIETTEKLDATRIGTVTARNTTTDTETE